MTQVTDADQGYTAEDMAAAEALWNDLPVFPTKWHTMPPHMKALVCRVIARHREQAVQEAVAELKPWRDAIDDALVCAHLGTADSFPDAKTALHKLICWEIDVALDPRVSDRARDLMAERDARIEALEAALRTFENAASMMNQWRSTLAVRVDGISDPEQWRSLNDTFDRLQSAREKARTALQEIDNDG